MVYPVYTQCSTPHVHQQFLTRSRFCPRPLSAQLILQDSWGINKFDRNRMESSRTTQSFRIRCTYSNPAFLEGEDAAAGDTKLDGASSSDHVVAGRSSDDSVIVLGRFDSVMSDVDTKEVCLLAPL